MKLVAQILTGSLFYIEVEEDATVGELKQKIGNQEKLPSHRLILMLDVAEYQRVVMDDNDVSLKEYGAQDSSHVYVFFEPVKENVPLVGSTPWDSFVDLAPPIPWGPSLDPPSTTRDTLRDPPSSPPVSVSSDDKCSSSCEVINEYMDVSSPNADPPSDKNE